MPPFRSTTVRRSRKSFEVNIFVGKNFRTLILKDELKRTEQSDNDKWVHDLAPEPDATTRLAVSNLHWDVTENELANIFGAIGTLASKPVIRYDRSGRSTGVATVEFVAQADAAKAKNQLDGKIAKTQAMSITFGPQRNPALARKSLLNRVEKPQLLARISLGRDAETKLNRNRRAVAKRGARGGATPRGKKTATAADLDKELDAFMSADAPKGDVEMS